MIKKTMKTLAMAFLVGTAAAVRAGDIVSIDVLEDAPYSLYNGGKTYPNDANPHSIGESIFIRIRLVNYDVGRGDITGTHDARSKPYPWEYTTLTSYGDYPKLGLLVGGVTRYATYVSCRPTAETVRNSQLYYTDLIFEYVVLPGDLAQPIRLRSKSGGEVTTATDKLDVVLPGFYAHFENAVDTSDPGDVKVDADFSFCSDDLEDYGFFSSSWKYPPANSSADELGSPRRDPTLQGQAVYVKTIDFDSDYVDRTTDPMVWRTIAQGSTKPTKLGNPSIVIDAAATFEGTGYATMWIWTDDDDILTPVGETQTYNVNGTDRKALPIKISTGDEQKLFVLKATGVEGDGAWVYMSSAPTNMYGNAGELIKNTVRRWVGVGAPEKPSVSVTFRGNSWAEATAKNGYMEGDYPVEMAITLSEPASEEMTVTLNPVLLNDGTNIDVYANHVIATAPSAGLGNGWQLATNVVTFAAGDAEKFLYVYPLGATKGSARNGGTGIEFQISVEPATAAAHFVTKTPGVLYVNPAAPNVLAPVSGQTYEFTAGVAKDITITIDDSCRNMRYLDDGSAEVVVEGTNLYTVVWERNDDTSTSRLEWKGLKPKLTSGEGTLTLTDVRYPNSGTYLTSQITITGPEGKKTVIPVSAEVSVPRTVTCTPDHANLTYSEGDTVKLTVNLSKLDGEDLYAFVEPLNEAATNCLSGGQVIGADGKARDVGVLVPRTGTVGFKTLDVVLNDGYCEPKFQVVLCSNETYDKTKVVDRYTPVPVTIICENVAPAGGSGRSMHVGGFAVTNNATLPAPVPADNLITLRIDINDVGPDRRLPVTRNEMLVDWINGADPADFTNGLFIVKWSFYNPNGMLVDTRITLGSAKAGTKAGYATTNYVFTSIGDNEVAVQMLDKDMVKALLDAGIERSDIVSWEGGVAYGDENGYWKSNLAEEDWGPEYRVVVPVTDKANVSVVPVNATVNADGDLGFNEGQTSGKFDIRLSVPAEKPLKVKLWLERIARTDGVKKDLPTLGSLMIEGTELAMDTNEYVNVEFKRGAETMTVKITSMDGTPYSQYTLHAVVTTTTKNDNGVPLNDFYNEGAYDFGVFNYPDPKLNSIMANVGISYNQSTSQASTNVVTLTQNQEVSIDWVVADNIRMDETNNFTVTWNSTEPGSMSKTNDVTSGTYTTRFSSAGEKTITLTINDKDGGANFYEWHFNVEASKRLYLYPHKPNNSALSDPVASTYMLADGLGLGTVEADGGLGGIVNFAQTWDYDVQANSAHIYARGLAKGETDTNTIVLAKRAGYPTQYGGLTTKAAEAFENTALTNFDSFAYAFIENTAGEGSVFTPVLSKIQPQAGSEAVEHLIVLPLAEKDAVAYPDRYLEVIFSREWREEDNCGDINADGVPDAFAIKVWRGGKLLDLIGGGTSGMGTISIGSDLVNLAAFNPDLDKLPGVYSQGGTLGGVSGYNSSYAPVGIDLATRLEIRGFDLGLNDQTYANSDVSFSDDELFAWTNLITSAEGMAKGYSTTNEQGEVDFAIAPSLAIWTPEPGTTDYLRMDPTLDDTDVDGYPDGWEYFFWYQAKVWVPAFDWRIRHRDELDRNGNKLIDDDSLKNHLYPGQPRAGQTYTFERFTLDNIVVGVEIPASEVMERFDPCTPYNAEAYGGSKPLKYDFDNDGLSDLEELVLGTNPCHWDTDGDRLCDAWEVMMCLDPINGSKNDNPDGDFMAYYAVRHAMCWIDPDAAVTDPSAEGVRIYVMPNLQFGVDYTEEIDLATRITTFKMLKTVKVTDAFSFTPKFEGPDGSRERVVYGLRDDIPNVIVDSWIHGGYMVDRVVNDPITLKAGTEIFDGHFGDKVGYVLVHDQVRDAFGFDPRTGWSNKNGYVSDRWDPSHNGSQVKLPNKTGEAVNTRPYSNYDEYLVMKYRLGYNIDYSPMTDSDNGYDPSKESMWSFIRRKTTNPNVVYPTVNSDAGSDDGATASASTNETAAASIAKAVAAAFNQSGSSDKSPVTTHGADTDLDAVPDGWELYMYRNPNAGPITDDENPNIPNVDHDDDELSWAEEYAGVDSCEAYKGCESIYKNHPGRTQGWWNKFFPTNPGTMKYGSKTADDGRILYAGDTNEDGADTDGDGVKDALEGGSWKAVFANNGIEKGSHQVRVDLGFVYGNPATNVLSICYRGGGMNPCTIDTDLDGLPDGWEMQHAGVPVQMPGMVPVPPNGGTFRDDVQLDSATFIADGVFSGWTPTNSFVYIAGGMDATWAGDAAHDEVIDSEDGRFWDDLLGTARDVDFDHDGLQNYQEYMTQAMRHFRYDDVTTPLMGRIFTEGGYHVSTGTRLTQHVQSFGKTSASADGGEGTGSGFPIFDPASPENTAANAAEAWYGRSFVYYETVTTGVNKVVKVINDITGESITNYTYYTAQKKRFLPGATIVADHVNNGGDGYQQPWTADGWRNAGYFAPPRHSWDQAIASRELSLPLYMYPITDGFMVASDVSIAGYATTDPRIADTDADGMDDYYEMFHGLNPLLGTTPANANDTTWFPRKSGDIISAQFYMKNMGSKDGSTDSLLTFNAWCNEWIYPTYNGIMGRKGREGIECISVPQAYDPVMYPWGMGSPMVDADGDGVRNDEERIVANVADPVHRHTDPTPLWFTERTTPSSYVAQYYVMPDDLKVMPWGGRPYTAMEEAALQPTQDATYNIYNYLSYAFSFEENEGYDTDGDMTPDSIESVKMVRSASDPLRFDDPTRRQALYLDGDNSFAMSRDRQARPVDSEDFLKQFTVECWFLPERLDVAQTIIDRSVAYEGDSINTAMIAIRSNFRIGLTNQGHVYGMFDNNDSIESGLDEPKSCQFVDGGPVQKDEWTHVALTFNGSKLILYVNGMESVTADTALIPANGVVQILQNPSATNSFTASKYSCAPSAFFVGARPIKASNPSELPNGVYALYPYYIDPLTGNHLESFDNLQEYFKGYVDEVRVWDGARTGDQILANYRKSIGYAEAKENRNDVFMAWYNNGTRNNNDGKPNLPAELVLNFDFSTLPGAVDSDEVAKVPAGFYANVLSAASSDYITNPDIDTTGLYNIKELKGSTKLPDGSGDGHIEGDLLVGWWKESLLHSTVYSDYHVVPWIKNTVSHLPFIDGAAPDSFVYSDKFGAVYTSASDLGYASFTFPNTADPYSSVVFNQDRYYRVAHARIRNEQCGEIYNADYALTCFQVRNSFIASADLVPMGGAYAKTCPELWDGGVADPWEQTKTDTNGDSIPDWWEKYARNNYSPDIDPSASLGWDTIVKVKFGDYLVELPAGKAYVIDLYRGMQPGGDIDPAYASNVDSDANNIPDWWENLFGVAGHDEDYDSDGDGLSNFAEYLFSFGGAPYGLENGYPLLDPANQRTGIGQKVTDYFIAAPADGYMSLGGTVTNVFANMYLGAIATDHDFMEDWWENLYSRSYANPRQYDPLLDRDGDGWSNWAEVRTYCWQGGFNAQYVDSYLDSNDDGHQDNHPAPAIGVTPTYYGSQDVSGCSLVVRTYSGVSPRMDAKFLVTGSNSAGTTGNNLEQTLSIGAYVGDVTIRGFLHPGRIIPGSMNHFYIRRADAEVTFFWHCEGCPFHGSRVEHTTSLNYDYTKYGDWLGSGEFSGTQAQYYAHKAAHDNATLQRTEIDIDEIATTSSTGDAQIGKILSSGEASIQGKQVGTINYTTGEYALDLEKVIASGVDLENMMFVARYYYRIGDEWPQTLWMSHPAEGFVKEGLNTIEAFFDLDNNGTYTAGEPYGVVKGVDVGWHKTQEIVIELKDTSCVVPRINIADGSSDRTVIEGASSGVSMGGGESSGEGEGSGSGSGATRTIRIVRNAINGQESRSRQVMSHTYVIDDRPYIMEADILSESARRFDLDWKYLASDAKAMGLVPMSADYSIVETFNLPGGGVTNTVLGSFIKTFKAVRPSATPVTPVQSEEVYNTASPALSFACGDETATAFRIQIADNTGSNIVYDSGVKVLGGRSSERVGEFVYRFTPPVYADVPVVVSGAPIFKDGAEYKWHVALFNAAFPADADFFDEAIDSADWSDWADFTMDVGNKRINPSIPTGYGKAGAVVRYYGPLTNEVILASNIIVEAHATADFRSQPLSQARLANVEDIARRDNISTTNAVLKGIVPGTAYLMAYIDQNNNGRRDDWESWGYVNFVGTTHDDIYTPKGITVVDSIKELPTAVIYIEDCDVNRNEIADCLEPENFLTLAVTADDSDRDGVDSSEEADIGTDPGVWDTDGDGMPDGWEYIHSNNELDPLEQDADLVGSEADVMAYAEIPAYLVTVKDAAATYDEGTVYAILDTSVPAPQVGDNMAEKKLMATYIYGNRDDINGTRGVGREVTLPTGNLRVTKVEENAKVALVHAQVYDWFGFNSKTCVADDDAVNTKVMTALDKYLVVRYLEAIGVQPTNDEKDASSVKWDACSGLEDWVNCNRKWDRYTLVAGVIDGDWSYDLYTDRRNGDGIADGWELYVMFQPDGGNDGLIGNVATMKVNPWDYADARTASPSNEDPAFRILDEFDGGNVPTDPYSTDTDGDGINDYVAWKFQIKGGEMQLSDYDNDGLSNWAEYLAQKLCDNLGLTVKFDVFNPCSAKENCLDYFYQVEQGGKKKYIGECIDADGKGLIADHDFMEDDVEDALGLNRYVYDANLDNDQNGWDNWSEVRARYNEATWVQVSTTTGTVAVTFNVGDLALDTWLLTNTAPVVRKEVYYKNGYSEGWVTTEINGEEQDYLAQYSGDDRVKERYTVIAENPVYAYVGNPSPNIEVKLIGFEGEASNLVVAAYSKDIAAGPYAYLNCSGAVSGDKFIGKIDGDGVRQGSNTFVVMANGKVGFAYDVNVGYDRVPELLIELRDEPLLGAWFEIGPQSNATTRVRVVRTAINGEPLVKPRAVYAKTLDLSEGRTFTEVDFIKDGEYDFDWANLVTDATAAGLASAEAIRSATYAVYLGWGDPEPVYVFTKEFEMAKLAPAASGACAEHGYVVASARPTLMWQAREGYSAFALQIATDKNDFENTIVYDKPGFMPAATEEGCVFTPEFYVEDGKTYYWRVAQLNAKFKENKWSDITSFKAAIDSSNSDTGYGALAAEVRYFGPSAATIDKVVVGVYESADFASAPVARKSLSGADAVSSLIGDATKPFLEVKANVTLDGIAPGSYYVMAFIDTNGDKVRDPYESWGYACKIGTDAADKWTPVAVDVVSSKAAIPAALVVMEDTDVNQNWTPDCLEDMVGWIPASEVEPEQPASTVDSDGDGLTDVVEDDYGTDPSNDDTDADGMPDGWEVRNGLDPLFNDADFALPLDYMAYAEHTVQVAVKGDKVYAVKTVTNEYGNVTSRVLYDTFELEDGTIVVGKANTGVTIAANTFYTTTTTNAVLIHSAVYDWFGFDPTTALPVAAEGTNTVMAANTAPFTAYWKYVTEVGYLKGLFNINYALNARAVDVNANGLPDGWELYVAFAHILAQGAQNTNTTFPMSGNSLATAIAEFDEGRQTADPWDAHYFFKQLEDDEYVTPYTNVEARRYNIVDGDFMKDEDLDGLSNYNEFLALKKHNVALDVHNATTDNTTLDYFRKSTTDNTKYLGLALNGGEFIEEPARKAFGVTAYNMAGTRVMDDSGWDLWSEIRAYLANPENSLYGEAVSEEGVTNATAEIASLSLVKPVPTIPLTLRYFGNATKTVVVEAYQGRESVETVRWTVSAVFDGGVAKVTLGAADEGSLKQGKARFVAYFDESADGFTPDDAFGMDEVEIGWSGTPVDIRIGEATSLPFIELAGETNGAPISAAAIVRTAINGKRVEPRGIWRRVYANNVSRAVLHPGDFVTGAFIGVDPGLVAAAAQAGIDPVDIESATYEVLTGSRPYSITNLNSYVVSNEVVETGNDNQTFTYNYSLIRDVAYGLAYFDELAGSAGLTFTLPETPESLVYTKFWIKLGKGTAAMTEYGGTRGFLLPNATEGHVTLDAERLAALGIPALTEGDWQFTVAVGNDKFGKPEADEYSAVAKFHVNKAANFDGKIKVVVKHPLITPAAANLVVAVYDSPDLANAVKVQRVTNVGNIEIAGLHENGEYYVAAWYVSANDARLGNDGMLERKPWDTWGYATELGEEEYCFAPKAYRANGQTVTFWLQDTDWNDNNVIDRNEKFLAEDGNMGQDKASAIFTDFNLNGIDDDWELFNDEDPTFVDEGELVDDVMAYAELPAYLVTVKNNANAADLGTVYAIIDIPSVGPSVGDNMKGWTLLTTYDYGGKVGVGREVTIPNGDWRIIDIDRDATVVLVHAQVYQRFGFNTKTCVFDDDAVNTKHMTMLDKYLVVRYLENIGVRDPAMGLGATLEDWVVAGKRWGEYTLRTKSCDLDLDSVRDGWELYVMFGPYNELGNEAFHFAADKKASPWVYDDRTSDFDGDELPLYLEYDDGYWPTDPWNIDTDGDHVFDVYAYTYHLKGNDAGKDADRDGLSNYAEYLISEVFQVVALDPDDAMTDGSTLDCYRKFGDLYLGEVFSDHDRIDDEWEAQYEKGNLYGIDYAARGIYDPDLDLDNDGWSNYAEFRAGTSPARQTSTGIDDYTLVEHPVPVVQMEVVYNGTADIEGKTLTVKAWSEQGDNANALGVPDATWTVTTHNESVDDSGDGKEATKPPEKYIGRMPTGKRTYYLGGGSVKEGSFKLCIKDKNYVEGTVVTLFGQNYFQATSLGDSDTALWFYNVIDREGKLVTRGGIFAEAHEVGTIDYDSGRVTIDFDDKEFTDELLVGDPENDAVDSDSSKNNGQNATKTYHGLNPPSSYVKFVWSPVADVPARGIHYLGDADSGTLREGLTTFIVEATSSSDTSDTTGGKDSTSGGQTLSVNTSATLYGVVRNVDVGWAGAKFTVELTDYNPITPRMDLVSGSADRVDSAPFSDYRWGMQSNRLEAAEGIPYAYPTKVRVVRYAINGYPIVKFWGKDLADVVYNKIWDHPNRKFCELDFLVDDKFDIDWTDSFTAKVANTSGTTRGTDGTAGNLAQVIGSGTSITNIEYLVVIGDGPIAWERGADTNTVVTARVDRIVRRFDYTRATPVPVSVDGVQYSARPTFKWYMSGEEKLVSRFGSSYTAFKLQVKNSQNKVVYDSGIQRAPKVDADGNFTWTAPICVGSMLTNGVPYDTIGSNSWQVTMYNAKFRSDSWSAQNGASMFTTAVNAQQEVNDHGYSSIAVAVRYAGSSIVLEKCADMTTTKGKVIVQAFSTPDFSGDPLSSGIAMSDVAELARPDIKNAWLKGLPAIGTYYVRAFIDMDGDGKLSEWEPWGYVADAVTLVNDGTMVKAPLVSVWIDDSDSDRDWIPDAYEYAAKGWKTSWETLKGNNKNQPTGVVAVMPDGEIVLPFALDDKITTAAISSGLPGASLTAMQSERFVSALLGLNLEDKTTIEAIYNAAKANLDPKSVKVVAFSLTQDGKAVNLSVGADVASGISGTVIEKIYEIPASKTVKVKIKVLKKKSLEDALWTEFYTTPNPVTITSEMYGNIEVPLGDGVDLSSGFFKVELEEVK